MARLSRKLSKDRFVLKDIIENHNPESMSQHCRWLKLLRNHPRKRLIMWAKQFGLPNPFGEKDAN